MPIIRKQYQTTVGGKELVLEISNLAGQANAAVLAHYGETVVLVTVVMPSKEAATDYLPLKVDYEERFYAAGKIIGSRFIRREGRPSEEAILAGRMVDRVIRPLFDHRIRREIQVVVTVLAIDEENDPDFLGLIAASTALGISNVPWNGPVAGVRIAGLNGQIVISPNNSDMAKPECAFEAFVAGPRDQINMVELGGREVAEQIVADAFQAAQKEINALIAFQDKIIAEAGRPKTAVAPAEPEPALLAATREFLASRLEGAVYRKDKTDQHAALDVLRAELLAHLATLPELGTIDSKKVGGIWEDEIDALVHRGVSESDRRPDGRRLDEVRELAGEVGLFARTHGSAIFARGTTQALAVTTLAAPGSEQLIETMETTGKRRFMLHYNFPPYSVGETGMFRGPGRREIGHGALARKAIEPLIPSQEEFPYTIRVVSEILSSNGSSSMATVCASILSLMDAGVPIKKPAVGISMGLIADGEKYKILTDIQGPEDFYGDMDFKVAGTKDGITAIQLDTKVTGISLAVVRDALAQARTARSHILDFLATVLAGPRPQISPRAPAVYQLTINPEKIGALIGPGGKIINGLIKKYELATIDVEDDGRVYVAGSDQGKATAAVEEIRALTRDFTVGEVISGEVLKILDFGAIINLGGGRDGMVHVSELKNGYTKSVSEVLKVGDFVQAKIIRVEDGKIGLSIKQL